MLKLGLIGKNISHSKSPQVYEKLIKEPFSYELLDYKSENEIPNLREILNTYDGINITAPYKTHFLKQLDINLSPVVGINVVKLEEGKTVGANTDYSACLEIINDLFKQYNLKNIILLGDGVMANLIQVILKNLKLDYEQRARKLKNLENVDQSIGENLQTLVINTCAREYTFSTNKSDFVFWDLNYNLERNRQNVLQKNSVYIDGMGLLELQAKYAISFWNLTNC